MLLIHGGVNAVSGELSITDEKTAPFTVNYVGKLMKIGENENKAGLFSDVSGIEFRFKDNLWFDGILIRSGRNMEMMANLNSSGFFEFRWWMARHDWAEKHLRVVNYSIAGRGGDNVEKCVSSTQYINLDLLIEYAQLVPEVMRFVKYIAEAYKFFLRENCEPNSHIVQTNRIFEIDSTSAMQYLLKQYPHNVSGFGEEVVAVHDIRGAKWSDCGDVLIRHKTYSVILRFVSLYHSRYHAPRDVNNFVKKYPRLRANQGASVIVRSLSVEELPEEFNVTGDKVLLIEIDISKNTFNFALNDLAKYLRFHFQAKN